MVRGRVERFDSTGVTGWVRVGDGTRKAHMRLTLDGSVIASAVADGFRDDLKLNGAGDGCYQFTLSPEAPLSAEQMQRVKLRFAESDVLLELPRPEPATSAAATATSPTAAGTVPAAGPGLWIDGPQWVDELALRHRLGQLSDEQAAQIFQFVRDGFLVIHAAVSAEIIAGINADIDAVWNGKRRGAKIETFEPDGQLRILDAERRYRDGRTKLLDLYALSPAARSALQSEPILSFLRVIFDDTPVAFQGLSFWKGSQQPMHKDTAFVRVDGNPRAFAATWLALEDIRPGTGELEYYVGSHHAPEFKFGGHSKWMHTDSADYSSQYQQFLASLHDDAQRLHHRKSSFLGRAGDVLIWHADLAHGGSAITERDATRRSFVAHFCPERYPPHFLAGKKRNALSEGGVTFVSQHTAKFL